MPQRNPYEHITRVPCTGGPLTGQTVAIYHWGKAPQLPQELPIKDLGIYRHTGTEYRWTATT